MIWTAGGTVDPGYQRKMSGLKEKTALAAKGYITLYTCGFWRCIRIGN